MRALHFLRSLTAGLGVCGALLFGGGCGPECSSGVPYKVSLTGWCVETANCSYTPGRCQHVACEPSVSAGVGFEIAFPVGLIESHVGLTVLEFDFYVPFGSPSFSVSVATDGDETCAKQVDGGVTRLRCSYPATAQGIVVTSSDPQPGFTFSARVGEDPSRVGEVCPM